MTSIAEQSSQNTNFLFDFLYLDRDRISSYAAQFFDSGVLTSIKQVSGTNESSIGKTHAGLGRLAGYANTEADAINRSIERNFDAVWSTPLNVINSLDEHGYIHRDVKQANYGQIIRLVPK